MMHLPCLISLQKRFLGLYDIDISEKIATIDYRRILTSAFFDLFEIIFSRRPPYGFHVLGH